ncbi:PDZ domain-containing protein [Candidatus Poribacteria bacterium]|nr:PDZ domain-containing protein [Candidatus Poribacteria bacterium]MYG05184.1 PDZ domain-containing protein [Candidatus Poribacteria bacterium]MYK24688.1 PDZ domain-containing protein [Candidatus Poribacteria bacterium]
MKKNMYVCFAFLLFVVSASTISSCAFTKDQSTDVELLSSIENAFVGVAKRSTPAIVGIVSSRPMEDGEEHRQEGSGFIFRKDGHILTNEHVIRNATAIKVQLLDESEFDARLVGVDRNTDIAVLKIDAKKELPILPLANSEEVQVGQFAIAIGNPFRLNHTVTTGIVSGKGRSFLPDRGIIRYQDFIQTDAWINTGNSGGPLLNIHGEVIGVNSLIRRADNSPATGAVRAGAGFAISSNLVEKIGTQLIENGRIIRGFLGIRMEEVQRGIRIEAVYKNMPAYLSGLKRGDIIIKYNGRKVEDTDKFKMWVADSQVGTESKITVLRNGHERMFNVTIEEMPALHAGRSVEIDSVAWKRLGLSVRKLEKGDFERYTYLTDKDRGVIVDMVQVNSPIPIGTLITAVNGKNINSVQELEALLQRQQQELKELVLDVKSSHGEEKVTMQLNLSR